MDTIIFTSVTDNYLAMKAIGAYKIASQIRSIGKSCLVVDHFESFTADEIISILEKSMSKSTLFVGFSTSFFASYENNKVSAITDGVFFPQGKLIQNTVVSYIKVNYPHVKIVLGGNKVYKDYPTDQADYLILGFAESAILNLIKHIETGVNLKNQTTNQYGVTVIDDRKALSYDITKDNNFYWEESDILNEKVLPIELSRGCIFKCKFCSYPFTGKKNMEFVKQGDCLKKELIRNFELYRIKDYYILDDTFNDNMQKINQIHSVIKQLSFQPRFWAYVRLDLLARKPEQLDLLYEIGIRFMYFGIETFNEKTGRLIGKGGDRDKQIRMLELIRKKYPDVRTHGSFIVGLPYESIDSIKQTIHLLTSGKIPLHSYGVKPLKIYDFNQRMWSSDFDINYEKYGYRLIKNYEKNELVRFDVNNSVGSKNLLHKDTHYSALNWQNDCMDFSTANDISDYAKFLSNQDSDLPFQWSRLSLINYGYSFDDIIKVKISDDFFSNLKETRKSFIINYKKLLHRYLDKL